MTLTLAIICFKLETNGNIIFPLAWKRFLSRINCKFDIVFVNNGFNQDFFEKSISPFRAIHLRSQKSAVPFDTESTFFAINSIQSDFIVRIDHDAFPSSSALSDLYNFLIKNPPIDILSASNFPRSILAPIQLDTGRTRDEDVSKFQWKPWMIPSQNGDLLVIRKSFFSSCLNEYRKRFSNEECPFGSNVLTFRAICALLGLPFNEIDFSIKIDGSINVDFWTIMVLNHLRMGGITDRGRSFRNINHIIRANEAMRFKNFEDVIDPIDISYPHAINVSAPYFHLGNGYLADMYFYQNDRLDSGDFLNIKTHFVENGWYVAHYAIVDQLVRASGDNKLIELFNNSLITKKSNINLCRTFIDFYAPAIEDYL